MQCISSHHLTSAEVSTHPRKSLEAGPKQRLRKRLRRFVPGCSCSTGYRCSPSLSPPSTPPPPVLIHKFDICALYASKRYVTPTSVCCRCEQDTNITQTYFWARSPSTAGLRLQGLLGRASEDLQSTLPVQSIEHTSSTVLMNYRLTPRSLHQQ